MFVKNLCQLLITCVLHLMRKTRTCKMHLQVKIMCYYDGNTSLRDLESNGKSCTPLIAQIYYSKFHVRIYWVNAGKFLERPFFLLSL